MGSPSLYIKSDEPTLVITGGNTSDMTLTNESGVTIYVDDVSTCSPASNDFAIKPGQSISWPKQTFCYAISDPSTNPALLNVSNNVFQYSNPAISNANANQYGYPVTGGPIDVTKYINSAGNPALPYYDVSAFASVRVRIYSPFKDTVIANAAVPFVPIYFTNVNANGTPGAFPESTDQYYLSNGATNYGLEVVLPVKGRYLSIWYNSAGYITPPNGLWLEVIGYPDVQPQLGYEWDAAGTFGVVGGKRTVTIAQSGLALGTFYGFNLPMYSGKADLTVAIQQTSGSFTTVPWATLAGRYDAVPTALLPMSTVPTGAYYGIIQNVSLSRVPQNFSVWTGLGATGPITVTVKAIFHGNEDT